MIVNTPTHTAAVSLRQIAIVAAILFISTAAVAAPAVVQGHVLAGDGAASAAGTQVTVHETGQTVPVAPDGSYSLSLNPGTYTLEFEQAPGGFSATRRVSVVSGGTTTQDVKLDRTVLLGKMVVSADYMPADIARATQQNAPNLVNILTAQDIRKLPDVNAAEAVRRVSGIALEIDTGEGRFVNIRGMDADLNSTTFGGVRLPPSNTASPLGGGRAVAMDSIPAGVISAITVTKTNRPDQDAEALGGTIEITPKMVPANGRPFVEGHIGTGIETQRHTGIFDGELTFGGSFGPSAAADSSGTDAQRPFTVLGSVARYNDGRGIDDIEASYQDAQSSGVPDKAYSSLDNRYYRYHRHRYGNSVQVGYAPNAQNSWQFRFNEFGYTEYINRQRLIVDNMDNAAGITDSSGNALPAFQLDPKNPNAIIAPAAIFKKALRDDEEHTRSRVTVLSGKDDFNAFAIDYNVSYSEGSFHKPHDYNSTFKNPNSARVEYDNTTNSNYPVFQVLSGPNPASPSGYVMSGFNNGTQDVTDKEWGSVLNVTVPTQWTAAKDDKLKFGVGTRLRDRTQGITSQNYSSVPKAPLPSMLEDFTNIVFYKQHVQNGPNISALAVRNLFFSNPSQFPELTGIDQANSLIGYAKDTENVYSAYGEYEFSVGDAGFLAGVRAERTHASYKANQVATDADGNLLGSAPISQAVNYTDLFPSVQLKYKLLPNLIGRAAFSTAIARPGFNQVTAATSINPGADTVQQGNPNLKATTGQNYDVAIEYYLSQGGIASVGVFDKEFKNYIANRIVNGVVFPNNGLFAGFTGPARVITFLNIPSARARGVEISYSQKLVWLQGFLGGFGFDANYSYVDSRAEIRPGEQSILPSTSRNVYNAAVFYQKYGVGVRLAASFVGKNIFGVGGSADTDTWSQDRFNLDLGTSYDISEHLGVYLNVKNLTDTALKFTEGKASNRPIQREFYGPTIQTGVRFDF